MASTFNSPAAGRGGPVGVSPTDWRYQLLKRVGAPVTWPNLDALQAWALSESGYNDSYGTNLAGPMAYNPLAITDSYGVPTTGDVNSAGVKQFGSTSAGVDATARFLEHGYGNVIQALKDSDPNALYQAVNQSGWCSGCEGGQYPVALASWLGGTSFQGEHGGFHGTSGGGSAAATARAAGAAAGHDTGGLYGACGGGTSVPLLPFSLPPFGCYLLQTVEFAVPAVGGAVLMLVGAVMVVKGIGLGSAAKAATAALPFVGEGVAIGALAGKVTGGAGKAGAAGAAEPAKAQRDQRAAELHAERLKAAKARTRQQRAQARVHESRSRQEKLAEGSPARLSAVEEARLKRGQRGGSGNRHPERMAG
jgi:hypothetical protein